MGPLILRYDDWPSLIAGLSARPGLSCLRDIPLPVACAVLAAPAALARWVAVRMPRLAASRVLSILVIGAETVDAPDRGCWYQVIPALLNSKSAIEVTLIGQELDEGFSSAAAAHAPAQAARCHRISLDELPDRNLDLSFDLAAVFQPGFQKHRGWLAAGGFTRLLNVGVAVVGSSYEADEYEMDRWVLECYGYRASAEPVLNPFVLELGDEKSSVRWGRALWQIQAAPRPGTRVNQQRLDALDTLTSMVMHSMTEVGTPSPACGAPVELRSAEGKSMGLVHIFDNRFVDIGTGRLSLLDANGELREMGVIPRAALASYPGPLARDIERAVWAAGVKSHCLLAFYPPPPGIIDANATARGMLAAMRDKASRLFK